MRSIASESNCDRPFLCGVVEGFYGRPWTTDQRKRLFHRMLQMGLNTYLYAPKDDSKHRTYWREMYTVEEAEHLTGLIEAADNENVAFVYALSPGLDMTYSSAKDVTFLKRKLEQVSSFGCRHFALLFDDIEVDMCEADKGVFQSFAHAHVSVTNEVFQHLSQPETFLFCPTEYCATRAVPNVATSEYLITIGSKLLPGVDIMWTGPKVISKKITIKSIEELTAVLQRPPVIWDNIHANDYDQRRLFLGPYEGRSSELIPYIRGVLTNPNCEYEANYIAMHTLAQWSRSNTHGVKKDFILSESPVSADIKLETDGEFTSDEDVPINGIATYQPKHALVDAIADWQEVFNSDQLPVTKKIATVAIPPPLSLQVPVAPVTCQASTITIASQGQTVTSLSDSLGIGMKNLNSIQNLEVNESYMQPSTLNVINSFVAPVNSLDPGCASDSEDSGTESIPEPMDCAASTTSSTSSGDSLLTSIVELKDHTSTVLTGCSLIAQSLPNACSSCGNTKQNNLLDNAEEMQVDSDPLCTCHNDFPVAQSVLNSSSMSISDIQLLVELFYTPFEHGGLAVKLLNDFHWLAAKVQCLKSPTEPLENTVDTLSSEDWHQNASKFQDQLSHVTGIFKKLCSIPNRALLYDLFPYIWDMEIVFSQLKTFISWLALGQVTNTEVRSYFGNTYTWANKMYQDSFSSGDHEPWVFRGGVQAEFQRMLPLEGAADLLFHASPKEPTLNMFHIRPYSPQDRAAVYDVCRKTCDDGMDGTEIFPEQPDLIGDKLVGALLTYSPEFCYVVEDAQGICGYILAAPWVQEFQSRVAEEWVPAMCSKYPCPDKEEGLSPAEELITSFHSYKTYAPELLHVHHPAVVRLDLVASRMDDLTVPKRALAAVVTSLRSVGAGGLHTMIHVGDHNTVDFYTKMGLCELPLTDAPEGLLHMGRVI